MDITFVSGSPSPVDNVRPSKRPRSETPGPSGLHPSGRTSVLGTEVGMKRLKREVSALREQMSQLEKYVKDRDQHHAEIRKNMEEMAKKEQNRLESRVREAEERVKELEDEVEQKEADLDELRKAMADAEDESRDNESQLQALLAEKAILKRNATDSNIEKPSTSSGFEEDSSEYPEYISTSQEEPNTTNIQISHIRSIPFARDSRMSPLEFEMEDEEIRSYVELKQEIIPNENENESPTQSNPRSSRDNPAVVTTSGVNRDVHPSDEREIVQTNGTGVSTENQKSRKKPSWMVQLNGKTPKSSTGLERRISHSQEDSVVKEEENSEINSHELIRPEAAQPDDQQASFSRLPDGGVSSGPNQTTESPLESEGGNDYLPPQQNGDNLILFPAGNYCCLVAESFIFLNWKKFYSRRGRDKPNYEKMFACKKCTSGNNVANQIQDHVWVKHEKKMFFCPLCYPENPLEFKQRALSNHAKTCHPEFWECRAFVQEAERKHNLQLQPNISTKWRRRR